MANQKNIDRHPSNPPQTVGDADDRFPTARTSPDPARPVPGEPRKPDPDARATEPAPEDSNRDHAARPGDDVVVPGAGIVSADADARPKESDPAAAADDPAAAAARKNRG